VESSGFLDSVGVVSEVLLIETMVSRIEMVLLRNFLISMLWQTLVQTCSRDG